jgi:hypothetical protein
MVRLVHYYGGKLGIWRKYQHARLGIVEAITPCGTVPAALM